MALTKVSRRTYNACIGSPDKVKAIAFAIYVKTVKPTSVIKDWSYRQLSRLTGLSVNTCHKRVDILRSLGLVCEYNKNGHNYIKFLKLRRNKIANKRGDTSAFHSPKHLDVDISKIDTTSVKTIELGLRSIFIVEVQKRKDFARQSISSLQNATSVKSLKKAERTCRRRGYGVFADNGISYKYIASKIKCGFATVKRIIDFGKNGGLFSVIPSEVEKVYVGEGQGHTALPHMYGFHYATHSYVVRRSALRFELTGSYTNSI